MKFKLNIINLYLIFLLFSISYVYSTPQCSLKLTCKTECSSNSIKLINGQNNIQNSFSLVTKTTQTT